MTRSIAEMPEKGPLGAGAGLLTGVHGATCLGLGLGLGLGLALGLGLGLRLGLALVLGLRSARV